MLQVSEETMEHDKVSNMDGPMDESATGRWPLEGGKLLNPYAVI